MTDKEDLKKYSLIKREPWTKEQIDELAKNLEKEKHTNPFQEENIKEYSLSDIDTKEELLKRYTYLYENKELILALCIRPAIDYEEVKQNIKDLKKETKRKTLTQEEKELIKIFLNDNKNILNGTKINYYLFGEVDDEITDAYEEFLFTDKEMENTTLYKHVEAVKNNEMYLASFKNMIEQVEERRKYQNQISNTKTFTVWKILSYVSYKNLTNQKLLKALDKYYNLDRYITTGFNFESGYEFLDKDIQIAEIIPKDYQKRITKGKVIYGLAYAYKKFNNFEYEDEYYDSYIGYEDFDPNTDYKTTFMYKLAIMPPIKEEDKKEFRNKLTNKSKGMMTKALKKCIINMEG